MMSRELRRWSVIAAMTLIACTPPPGEDDEPSRTMRRGDDLLGSGDEMFSADSVVGDVMLTGGKFGFSGITGGSYLGFGGEQEVNGRIHGSVRAAGGRVVVMADVGRNATIAGADVSVDTGASITHNAYLAGGMVRMAGSVGEHLAMAGRDVVLNGTIGGDVDVSAQHLTVGPRANIAGALRHRVPAGRVTIDPAARIGGGVAALPAHDWTGLGRTLRTIWLVGFFVAGVAAVALFPGLATAAAASTREHTGAAAAFGAAWLVGLPVAVIAAAITIIGLPLAMLATAAYLILAYLGRAVIAVWLGELVIRRWTSFRPDSPVPSFLVGGSILLIVSLVPIIGGLAGFAATMFGVGALLVALWPRRQPQVLA